MVLSKKIVALGIAAMVFATGCSDIESTVESAGKLVGAVADKATVEINLTVSDVKVEWKTPAEGEVLWQDLNNCPAEFLVQYNQDIAEDNTLGTDDLMVEESGETLSVGSDGQLIFTQEVLNEGSINVDVVKDKSVEAVNKIKENETVQQVTGAICNVLGDAFSAAGKFKDDLIRKFPNGTLVYTTVSEYSSEDFHVEDIVGIDEDQYHGAIMLFSLVNAQATTGCYNPEIVVRNYGVSDFTRRATITMDAFDMNPDDLVDILLESADIERVNWQWGKDDREEEVVVVETVLNNPNKFLTIDRVADNAIRIGVESGMGDCLSTNPRFSQMVKDGLESGKEITDKIQASMK